MVNYAIDKIKSIVNTGVKAEMPIAEAKYFMFTNFVSLLSALGIMLYVPYSIFTGEYALAAIQSIDALAMASSIILNKKGHYNASRFIFIIVVNWLVLMNSCFIGYESRMHEYFMLTNIVPFFIFSIKEVKKIVLSISISMGGFALYYLIYPYFVAHNLPVEQQVTIYFINMLIKFVLFGGSIYVLAVYNNMAESTLKASNEKLTAYAIDLERSNSDLENFAYVISHDLKSPINNISRLLQVYISKHNVVADKEGGDFLTLSLTSAQRLTKLIDDMLAYSRIGKNLPAESTVDTNLVVKTIEVELSERLKERNAQIVIMQPLPVLFRIHASMIYHVFQNLISNAIKFNKSPMPTVIISHIDMGTHYRFAMQDNGIGIKSEMGLFKMFRRLHTNEEYEGTGIGLAICKRVVSLYSGKIWFESQVGQGTTFYFDIAKAGIAAEQIVMPVRRMAVLN